MNINGMKGVLWIVHHDLGTANIIQHAQIMQNRIHVIDKPCLPWIYHSYTTLSTRAKPEGKGGINGVSRTTMVYLFNILTYIELTQVSVIT